MPKFIKNNFKGRKTLFNAEKNQLRRYYIDTVHVWVERLPEANLDNGRDTADYTYLNYYMDNELHKDVSMLNSALSSLLKVKVDIQLETDVEFDMNRNRITGTKMKIFIFSRNSVKAMILAEDLINYLDRYLNQLSKMLLKDEDRSLTWVSYGEAIFNAPEESLTSAETQRP